MQKKFGFFSFALPQTGETKTAFGLGRGEWRGFMYLQWNRIPKIYEKSDYAIGPTLVRKNMEAIPLQMHESLP